MKTKLRRKDVKIFAAEGDHDWFAARTPEEACAFANEEEDYSLTPKDFRELTAEEMNTMPFSYYADDYDEVEKTTTFEKWLRRLLRKGRIDMPSLFATRDWR